MSTRWFLFLALVAIASAKSLNKRSNAYGDEIVSPAPLAPQSYDGPAPDEQPAAQVSQPSPEVPASVQASGYRRKRTAQNAYGDELVTPAYGEQAYGAPAPVEQAPTPVPQPVTLNPAPVQASGYRKKRGLQNGYGDEAVAPVASSVPEQSYSAPVEQIPAAVAQTASVAPAPVQASGYRKKRGVQNGYGDEAVTPAAPGNGDQSYLPVPLEQAPAGVPQTVPAAPAPVQASGYRKKRGAQNGYGDEAVTVPAAAYGEQVYNAPAPFEQAPAAIAQPIAVSGPAPVQASGYRKKRGVQNGYGDEAVTPSSPAYVEQSYGVQAPVEQAPAAVAQTAVETSAVVQPSGYRKKRASYGDEPVAPSAPTVPEQPYPVPSEQNPAVVAQSVAVPASVQTSGYRKKRNIQNGYGDEVVTPVAPAYGEQSYGSAAPVEQSPSQFTQAIPSAPVSVQASGY
ncbi:hypothetical protein QR680_003413 [Steinernema hermaphroditum]|uniref:Uncharacterized protein n=1 Tax=Steinernema hermaphroditum TaxID=289476 RepID=A0AA39H6V3_9BILA|nr:hypothetical protein QR680_003413 [Steinernema hermaphroditum]